MRQFPRTAVRVAGEDIARRLAGLEVAPALLLAVSGGPDSMALMLVAARWAASLVHAPALHVATIDHGLRRESSEEAALVATAAAALGLSHAVLPWVGPKPATRVQERARATRYALLAAHANEIGATHVLTAHHADDQAETVLMRLLRGSGIGGLGGMRRETRLGPGVALVRPLIDVPKAELVAFCRAENIETVDDPSNRDPAFARTRLRADADALARLGLDRAALLRLARRAARADAALEAEAERVEQSLVPAGDEMSLAGHRELQPEILLRLLRRRLERVAPGSLRLDRLEALTEALATALRERAPHRATLAGARIALGADARLAIGPARPRRPTAARKAADGLD